MSAAIFTEGAQPRCAGCEHELRRHRWCAPYACLDCPCEHIYDRGHYPTGWRLPAAPATDGGAS